ncbi:MAG: hypothetical protein GY711_22280 [bacterium]|nr:hypothetical protein [bacterium]
MLHLALSSCGTTVLTWEPSWSAPYASFDERAREKLERVRNHIGRERWEPAWRVLTRMIESDRDNIEVGRMLQEVELELMARGSELDPALVAFAAEPTPEDRSRRLYAQRVQDDPSVAGYVLAARLESDAIAAESQLDLALELDPRCAWAHYGKAHALLRQARRRDRWRLARESLTRALGYEPGHIHARRLEAWMLGQEGELAKAVQALQAWLETTRGDPRVGRGQRIEGEVDLATLLLLAGRSDEALALLRSLEGVEASRARRLALSAVAAHELGDLDASRDFARRAEAASDDPLLALVQQALLDDFAFEDEARAEASWRDVLERAEERTDLGAILQVMRARVVLEQKAAAKGSDER